MRFRGMPCWVVREQWFAKERHGRGMISRGSGRVIFGMVVVGHDICGYSRIPLGLRGTELWPRTRLPQTRRRRVRRGTVVWAMVVPRPNDLLWRYSGQCWLDELATLCGKGISRGFILEGFV